MNRREALKQLAVLAGGTLSLSTIAGFMGGCSAKRDDGFSLSTLSARQNQLVIALTERIIPATDTPGAKAARVNQYIDHMLTNWNTEQERTHFLEGLSHVENLCDQKYNQRFVDLEKKQQISVLKALEEEATNNPYPKLGTHLKPFFGMLKEFTVVGYYTSEIGASQELNLNLVPGYHEACMPYSEVGRAWS